MNLVTPDSGLLFWMVLIFLVVLGILWKFGFPMITGMVEKRTAHIDESLRLAREAEERMKGLAQEQKELIEKTRVQQSQMLKEATATKDAIVAKAQEEARQQAEIIIEKARVEIAAEKESAMREIRRDVAALSIQVAEKILRDRLAPEQRQAEYIDKLIGEVEEKNKE
ncbi:MAG: F0F1 ATP synthase subunit B [Bacteroidales bacterium]|nr:F0F1 ATP synthase subunit B [Bacteroidales bacterium]